MKGRKTRLFVGDILQSDAVFNWLLCICYMENHDLITCHGVSALITRTLSGGLVYAMWPSAKIA